jgi:hypothetical protein
LAFAPSAEIDSPNTPSSISIMRAQLIIWQTCRYVTNATIPGPNGEPGNMSTGGFAMTRVSLHGHTALCRLMRVVIGLIGGRSL